MAQNGIRMQFEKVAPALGREGGAGQLRWFKADGEMATIQQLKDAKIIQEVFPQ